MDNRRNWLLIILIIFYMCVSLSKFLFFFINILYIYINILYTIYTYILYILYIIYYKFIFLF